MSGLYANPESVRTRVRKAIEYNARLIQEKTGYRNTVKAYFNDVPSLSEITQYPTVVGIFGKESTLNTDQSDQLWHKSLPVLFLVYLESGSDTQLAREEMLMDLEKHFWRAEDDGSYGVLRGEDGQAACMTSKNEGNEPFGMSLNKPKVGITFEFTVFYNQDILDPTVAG